VLRHIATVVSDVASRSRGATDLNISRWLDDHGYALLVADLLRDGAREAELTSMAERLGVALTTTRKCVDSLCAQHLKAVLT
ncbi:hypothetical protein ACQ1Z4_14505, partial [Enterococcus faecalis]